MPSPCPSTAFSQPGCSPRYVFQERTCRFLVQKQGTFLAMTSDRFPLCQRGARYGLLNVVIALASAPGTPPPGTARRSCACHGTARWRRTARHGLAPDGQSAMPGESCQIWHHLIVGNIVGELKAQLKGQPCTTYPSDMRLKVSATSPSVVCPTWADASASRARCSGRSLLPPSLGRRPAPDGSALSPPPLDPPRPAPSPAGQGHRRVPPSWGHPRIEGRGAQGRRRARPTRLNLSSNRTFTLS